jgi:hypothetical protein
MAPNGTRFGGWLLNTADNTFSALGDFDGDRRSELLVISPWGLGVLKFSGAALNSLVMVPNSSPMGDWVLNTLDNRFGPAADYKGQQRDQVPVVGSQGLGILDVRGTAFVVDRTVANGARLRDWILNASENSLDRAGDYDGDGRAELVISSEWRLGILDFDSGTPVVTSSLDWRDAQLAALIRLPR